MLGEQVLLDRLAVEQLDDRGDEDLAVALREVGRVGQPLRIAGDLLPGRRIGTLAGKPQLGLATGRAGRRERAKRHVVVQAQDDDDAARRERRELVTELGHREVGRPADVEAAELLGIDGPAGLLEAGDHAVDAGLGRRPGTLGIEGHDCRVLAVVLRLEHVADVLPGDLAGLRVVGAHEGDLARGLVDIDRDGRQATVRGADLGRAVLEELEVQDRLDFLDLEVLGACEGLRRIDLGVAEGDLDAGCISLLLDRVGDELHERDRLTERDVAHLHRGRRLGRRSLGCRRFAGGRLGSGGLRRRRGRRRVRTGAHDEHQAQQGGQGGTVAHGVSVASAFRGGTDPDPD